MDAKTGPNREIDRAHLLDIVESIGSLLDSDQAEGDSLRHLPPASLEALRTSGLLTLRVPRELGGYEADSALSFEIIERVAYHSSIAAWCLFIYADTYGKVSAFLSEEGIRLLKEPTADPVMFGGGGLIPGVLSDAASGVTISGRWIYGSGMTGADWALVLGIFPGEEGREPIFCVVPRSSLASLDNWNVMGLRGTSSSDFTGSEIFVPDALSWPMAQSARRGGTMYDHNILAFTGHAIPAVACGVMRRVLDDATQMATAKARGYTSKTTLAHRETFQAFLGRADIVLKAARSLMLGLCRKVATTDVLSPALEAEFRAAGAYAVQETVKIATELLGYIGGDGIREGKRFERAFRDLQTASTHFHVSNAASEDHGRFLLGLNAPNPPH